MPGGEMAEAEADIEAHVDVEAVGHPEPREHSFFFITVCSCQ